MFWHVWWFHVHCCIFLIIRSSFFMLPWWWWQWQWLVEWTSRGKGGSINQFLLGRWWPGEDCWQPEKTVDDWRRPWVTGRRLWKTVDDCVWPCSTTRKWVSSFKVIFLFFFFRQDAIWADLPMVHPVKQLSFLEKWQLWQTFLSLRNSAKNWKVTRYQNTCTCTCYVKESSCDVFMCLNRR